MDCVATDIKMLENDSAMNIFNMVLNLPAAQALHVAHELNLFERIGPNRTLSLSEIASVMHMQERPLQALLSMCISLNLIMINDENEYLLSENAKKLFLKESPFYLGKALDVNLMNADIFSFNSMKRALLENAPQIYGGKALFKTNEEQAELAKFFTHCMHGKSIGMSGQWPNKIDLSQNLCIADIGGGSGAHSISAVTRWPHLKAIIYDRPFVTEVADEYIKHFGLSDRIHTQIGDMWQDPLPSTDIHFYSDVFHDWTIDQCRLLAEKSFTALKPKGRILVHEMLFNDNKSGPKSVASYNLMMMLWTQGQQLSKKELVDLLTEVGFINIKVSPTGLGDWSIVEGQKH